MRIHAITLANAEISGECMPGIQIAFWPKMGEFLGVLEWIGSNSWLVGDIDQVYTSRLLSVSEIVLLNPLHTLHSLHTQEYISIGIHIASLMWCISPPRKSPSWP